MSLRTRILVWNMLALLASFVLAAAITGVNARNAVRTEVLAAIESAQRALLESGGRPSAVTAFHESRHFRVNFVDAAGKVVASSGVRDEQPSTPDFARRFLDPAIPDVLVAGRDGQFVIQAHPENEIGEIWDRWSDIALFPVIASFLLLLFMSGVLEQALRPLRALRTGFAAIGEGDYRNRLEEKGPSEIVELLSGFNRMSAQLADGEDQSRNLNQRLERVQEEERADLARDLHDEIGSYLFATNIDCAAIVRVANSKGLDDIRGYAESVQASVGHMQAHVRGMLERLRADPVLEHNLVDGLWDLAEFWSVRVPATRFVVDLPDVGPELDRLQRTNLHRVAQEALTNAIRHGKPKTIHLSLSEQKGAWELAITDDGVAGPTTEVEPGFGLQGMRERALAAGAELAVGPAPEGGWTVRARLVHSQPRVEGAVR